ncbi:MAG: AtpZ/AtpI family protein [Alphaproteobacteria bacterium]|nr:AtpZ/AtpI family protein [Alphaproteobacteria bacterium]
MAENDHPPPLDELEKRLAAARDIQADRERGKGSGLAAEGKSYGLAIRLAIEMVSTLAVGVFLGWVLDRWLDSGPWLLIVGFFLGAAAGSLNVYRVSQTMIREPGDGETG